MTNIIYIYLISKHVKYRYPLTSALFFLYKEKPTNWFAGCFFSCDNKQLRKVTKETSFFFLGDPLGTYWVSIVKMELYRLLVPEWSIKTIRWTSGWRWMSLVLGLQYSYILVSNMLGIYICLNPFHLPILGEMVQFDPIWLILFPMGSMGLKDHLFASPRLVWTTLAPQKNAQQ